MSYKSLESMIRSVVSGSTLEEAALGNHKGLVALAKRKTGDEKDTMMRAAEMMKKGQIKDLNMFMKAMDQSTHKAIMPYVDKKHYKALHEDIEEIDEKTLTPAELKKREEIAKAIERENPDMPMPQKMAIATAQAKKVAEDKEEQVLGFIQSLSEEVELEEALSGGYKAASEKSVKGGHRAHLKNPEGKTSYLGGTAYKTAKHAKGEAEAYHKAYFHTTGMKANDRGAERAVHDYRKKNAQHVMEDLNEAGHDDVKSAKNQVQIAMSALEKMSGELNKLNDEDALPTWWTNKVAIAVDKLDGMADYLDTQVEEVIDEARGGADEPDRHIIMQLRKAQDVDGNHPITFRGGKTAKVQKKHIDKILKTHDHPSVKPVQKRMMRVAISKSPQHLANFADKLKEDYDTDNIDSILNEAQYKVPSNYAAMMQRKKKPDISQQMADKAKRDNISSSDKDKLGKLHNMMKNANEATDKEVRMAKGVAFDKRYKGGNYTGAAKTIEKIRKGLSDHPVVKKALQRANEDTVQETKGAPKGYHFTRSGQLKKGDAGQDGPGGAMLRSDPLDKVRKKIPPLPEEIDSDGKEVIHTRKADFKLSKVRLPDGRMGYRKVKKEVDIEK